MKAGTTFSLVLKLIQKPKAIDEVIFTITNGKNKLTKSQNGADDGIYAIGINQEESELIKGSAMIEAQINYADKSVDKSLIKEIKVRDTLNTTPVDGNMPSGDDGVELVLECIEKGVALLITPESADELIESVTALFQDTKSIAQSVRDDADAGVFDGKDGKDGKDGRDGVDGKDGKDGINGKDGVDGKDGKDGKDGVDGKDGKDGIDGQDGKDGADGADGFSPTVEVKTHTADTYILDITDKNGTIETPNLQGQKGDKGDKGDSGNPIIDTAKGSSITLTDSTSEPINAISIMGKSTQNGTPTIDNPIPIINASSEVDVTGKNLITLSELTKGIDITNGSINVTDKINLTCSTAGNVRSSVYKGQGATYSSQERARSLFIPINYNVPIVLSLQDGVFDFVYGIITDQNYKVIGQNFFSLGTQSGKKYTPHENERFMCLQFGKNNATVGNTYSDNIQIEIGQSPTPFEFYKNLQKTAYTPILRGIPVSSGGNYTDNNGQMWLCDTIERYADGTGKLIQRVGYIASYNGETITTQYMSTTGGLDTGSTINYVLATPTETPLTAEQLEELELDTYYPTTNINSNADVVVEYVCDTKNYIDKKTSALTSAILSLGGNI